MVILLVALTFLAAILIRALLNHQARKRAVIMPKLEREGVALSPALASSGSGGIPQFPIGIYYDDGHAWVRLDEGNKARIGLDDFTQQVMGDIDEIEIPPVGSRLNRGEVAWRLRHGGRKLSQLAPLGGTVVEVNQRLSRDPSLANRSPYEEGWILKIHPKALTKEMPELMDSFQFRKHFDQTKAELRSFFNNEGLGRIYGDGEEVIRGAAEKLDERWWRVLVTQLFHSSPD